MTTTPNPSQPAESTRRKAAEGLDPAVAVLQSVAVPTSVSGNPRATSLPDVHAGSAQPMTAEQVARIRKQNTDRLVQNLLKRVKDPGAPDTSVEVAALAIESGQGFKLTHAELSALVEANPDHPVSKIYAEALKRTPSDEHPLVVERIHVEAIADNKDVEVYTTHEPGADGKMLRINRKRLIDLAPSPPTTPSTASTTT